MAGAHPTTDWQRLDLTPITDVRAPYSGLMAQQVSSTFVRGLRFGLLLSAGFWSATFAIGCWLAF